MNINDPTIGAEHRGIFTAQTDRRSHLYVLFYMPQGNTKFGRHNQAFIKDSVEAVRKLNNVITWDDVIYAAVGRLRYKPVCEPGFPEMLLPVQTPVRGLQIVDTNFCYPEDRGISESARLAKQMASHLE